MIKKLLLTNTKVILIEYTIVYLIKTFIIWEFTNPIQWIINIPTYTNTERGDLLALYLILQGIQLTVIFGILNPKLEDLNSK